jgi:glycosyltransferase involved in cell wall biosynthesis
MAVLEAMACRLPIVITDKCNFPEVAQKETGIIIQPNTGQLTDALKYIINSFEKKTEIGIRGRQLIEEKYTWDRIADMMIKSYEEILKCNASM